MLIQTAIRIKENGVIALLACVIAGSIVVLTGSSAADNAQAMTISVNRTNKSDRLPQAVTLRLLPNNSSPIPKRVLLGCDPAFRSVVDPPLAPVFKRCMA
jgi:hypothetical protein